MFDWEQFTTQASQFIVNVLKELDLIINKIFAEGIIGHFLAFLKAIGKIIIAILEMLVRLLKLIVK